MGFILGVVGTAQQLETANAGGGSGPTGVSIYSADGEPKMVQQRTQDLAQRGEPC